MIHHMDADVKLQFGDMSFRSERPPLTRGLSAKLTGGEKNNYVLQRFLSLRPFGAPPSSEGGLGAPAPAKHLDKLQFIVLQIK